MIKLTPFAISGLLIVLTHLPFAIFLFSKAKTKVAKYYALHILAVAGWGIFAFLLGVSKEEFILPITKSCVISVYLIPVFFLHAILLLTNRPRKFIIFLIYFQAIIFIVLAVSGKLLPSNRLVFNSFYYPQGGTPFLISFIFWMLNITVGHVLLINHYWFKYPNQTKQIRFLSISLPIFLWAGSMNFLPALGLNIYPVGNFILPAYSLITAYAILKHQILNVEIELKRGIVYSILVAIISALFLLIIVLLEKILQSFAGYSSILLSISCAFLLCLLFTPLRNKIQYFVDKVFFRGSREEIAEENERLRQEITRSEKLKAVATLASGLAHEVKNPLTAIKTFAEYLPEKKDDPEFIKKFSKIVGSEIDRIDGLVHQLLDFAKPSPLQLHETNIHRLLDEILDFLNNEFIKHGIKVIKNYNTDAAPPLRLDPNQLKQATLNIILNAIDAMPNGGTLTVGTVRDAEYCRVSIRDSGCGIDKKDILHIFDPFFSKKDSGTGLGLAITHEIIKKHGGNVRVESKTKIGTTFTIELPFTAV